MSSVFVGIYEASYNEVKIAGAWTEEGEAIEGTRVVAGVRAMLVFDFMDRPMLVRGVIRRWAMGLGYLLQCDGIAMAVLRTVNGSVKGAIGMQEVIDVADQI